jgi:hypothetical protein
MVKGHNADFDVNGRTFTLQERPDPAADSIEVGVAGLKAFFFVRDLAGDPAVLAPTYDVEMCFGLGSAVTVSDVRRCTRRGCRGRL